MGLLLTVLAVLSLYPAWYLGSLLRNYLSARRYGLPMVIMPLSPASPLWFMFSRPLHDLASAVGLGRRLTRMTYLGWEADEKCRPFVEFGGTDGRPAPAIVQVTPGYNWISVADPGAIAYVFANERKGSFTRPHEVVKVLDVFGPNISSAQGADWQRMRRITAASFGEATNRVVWAETVRQGGQMLSHWLAAGADGLNSTADDARMLALNVMLGAGFGQRYDFEPSTGRGRGKRGGDGVMGFREAIQTVLDNAILVVGIGVERLPLLARYVGFLAPVAEAVAMFRKYMVDTLDEVESDGQKGNLLSALVRASRVDKQLSQSEVFGNMFVYTFGGHDTTAHSLAFTFLLLSIHPEVQEWMREEMWEVFPDGEPDEWEYEDHLKLKRTLAVQYETMRLYNPLLGIIKGVPPGQTMELSLESGKKVLTLHGPAPITVNINAIHTSPQLWGKDSTVWRPSRWIYADADGVEQMMVPEKGVFQAWSDGPRSCPGKRFGQVEHLALMACLFHDYTVEAVKEKGETPAETTKRIEAVIADSGMTLNVHMKHPERARVAWRKL